MNKTDTKILKRGLIRVLFALMTAAIFLVAVVGFIGVAYANGYLAVLIFFCSVIVTAIAYGLLYAHGINRHCECGESEGEKNEFDITL